MHRQCTYRVATKMAVLMLVVIALLLGSTFLVQTHHDCFGEGCIVCDQMNHVRDVLELVAWKGFGTLLFLAALGIPAAVAWVYSSSPLRLTTLIALKARMDN